MTEEEIHFLLEAIGVKPASLWGTRLQARLEALRGSPYVNQAGRLTEAGRREIERRRRDATKAS